MAKFILIDQSIKGLGGHYLEYATHVLDAAEKSGFEPCIATNRAFNGDIKYKCLPVYSYDIWGDSNFKIALREKKRYLKGSLELITIPVKAICKTLKFLIKIILRPIRKRLRSGRQNLKKIYISKVSDFYFSDFGYCMELLKEKNLSLAVQKINPLKLLIFVMASAICGCLLTIAKILKAIVKIVKNVLSMPRKLIVSTTSFMHKFLWKNSFKINTKKVLNYYEVSNDDILFIPTLSNIDLMGLNKLIKANKKAQQVSWHLVFRRNLFIGREPDYKKHVYEKELLREITYECAFKSVYKKMFFYTDTIKLTEQYSLMHTVKFDTLPIPVNPQLESGIKYDMEKPINIIYLGDARREKGYQELPCIVDDLWEDYVLNDRVSFEFQSNFSFTNMDANCDIVAARDYLENLSGNYIKLYKKPLSSDEYLKLAQNGNIALLFYDRDNYYARSSGALVECLIGGIPVLVPSGSWLSEQICYDNYKHLQMIVNRLDKNYIYSSNLLEWRNNSEDVNINPMRGDSLSFGAENNSTYTTIKVVDNVKTIFVSYYVNELLEKGNFVKTQFVLCKDEKEIILYESDDYSTIEIGTKVVIAYNLKAQIDELKIVFSNAFGKNAISITDVEIAMSVSDNECILGEYGLVFSRYEDVSMLVKNMINYYPYYVISAKQKSREYKNFHNANKLIECLHENAKRGA